MKTLAMSVLALVSMSIVPSSAAPIKVAAQTSNGPGNAPWVGCSLSGAAVQNCRNVLGFKSFFECQSNRMERGWTSVESSYYCRALDLK
ncbi:hypothetical protein [Bradyrhizobium sp. TM239]|uniref:hypothetical protein n=1 Tax=Bradyrhizobium sp. TM239 TaxID=2599802 RepID=UPI0027D72F1C|nr:hypothetical protein TM239_25690 [Bradyrhizobium sp. TM239]